MRFHCLYLLTLKLELYICFHQHVEVIYVGFHVFFVEVILYKNGNFDNRSLKGEIEGEEHEREGNEHPKEHGLSSGGKEHPKVGRAKGKTKLLCGTTQEKQRLLSHQAW